MVQRPTLDNRAFRMKGPSRPEKKKDITPPAVFRKPFVSSWGTPKQKMAGVLFFSFKRLERAPLRIALPEQIFRSRNLVHSIPPARPLGEPWQSTRPSQGEPERPKGRTKRHQADGQMKSALAEGSTRTAQAEGRTKRCQAKTSHEPCLVGWLMVGGSAGASVGWSVGLLHVCCSLALLLTGRLGLPRKRSPCLSQTRFPRTASQRNLVSGKPRTRVW